MPATHPVRRAASQDDKSVDKTVEGAYEYFEKKSLILDYAKGDIIHMVTPL